MSGIAGLVRFDGALVEPGLVDKMTGAMASRGPDGIRHWRKGSVALGHCKLCTTAESLEEAQPLRNEDESLVLVLDGRLDNWEELRRELSVRGAALRDRSDAELVLRAYEAWGRECLSHIDGDFSFVVWDARRNTAFCARDRMGNKPFNYHWDGKTLAFASELHAILALPWVRAELNEDLLAEYLANDWRSRNETPWRGIHRLVEAHSMEVGPGEVRTTRYWQPDLDSMLVYRSDREYAEHYREVLADAIRRSSRTHRPLGCEVSGGLDSSAVFAVAGDLLRRHTLLAPSLAGFTLLFQDDSPANELDYARAVSTHVGLPVEEVPPTHRPLSWYRDWARKYREFPGYPNGIMGVGIREAARAKGCRVLLVGAGGDEWLTGSRDYYAEELAAGRWRNFLACLGADLRDAGAKNTARWIARSCAILLLPQPLRAAWRAWRARGGTRASGTRDWLSPRLRRIAQARIRAPGSQTASAPFARAGQAALYYTLHAPYDVLAWESEERLAASLGIELRRPLSNVAMVQFAFSTPARLWLRGNAGKFLHRRALDGALPARVLQRASKADFMDVFRAYGPELGRWARAQAPREDWLCRSGLDAALARFGDPSHCGVPEWQLWSWLGWQLLAAEGCKNEFSPHAVQERASAAVQ